MFCCFVSDEDKFWCKSGSVFGSSISHFLNPVGNLEIFSSKLFNKQKRENTATESLRLIYCFLDKKKE